MKRKTNLFYASGQDSNFLTFSNYTEALTGNFLSTNTKLFPSSFICVYVPKLLNDDGTIDTDKKERFIKEYLVGYYENKMAVIRDYFDSRNELVESPKLDIKPLDYLIKAIKIYDNDAEIKYIGNVTEQDWNGTYTDTICIIDSSNIMNIDTSINTDSDTNKYEYEGVVDSLNGWEGNIPNSYASVSPIFDDDNYYTGEAYFKRDNGEIIVIHEDNVSQLQFNIVIPMFTLVDTDTRTGGQKNLNEGLVASYNENSPLGIWISDNLISLSTNGKYGQSWSLTIGSQFKPVPYSSEMPSEVEKTGDTQAFSTFSQILAKQNVLLDKFNSLSNDLKNISGYIGSLQTRISYLEHNSIYSPNVFSKINEFDSYISDLTNTTTSLSSRLSELSGTVSDNKNEVDSDISDFDSRITTIETKLVGIEDFIEKY